MKIETPIAAGQRIAFVPSPIVSEDAAVRAKLGLSIEAFAITKPANGPAAAKPH